ncbi:hypothetical protein M3Y95_00377100 [Aphelenchoides besseyi]|nr:hypothetical protein M3Y95_00377100 [Aphelenchoides besseyi]
MNDVIQSLNDRHLRSCLEFYDTIEKEVAEVIKRLRPVQVLRNPLHQKVSTVNDMSIEGYEYAFCYSGSIEEFELGLRTCARYSEVYFRKMKPKSVARNILKAFCALKNTKSTHLLVALTRNINW